MTSYRDLADRAAESSAPRAVSSWISTLWRTEGGDIIETPEPEGYVLGWIAAIYGSEIARRKARALCLHLLVGALPADGGQMEPLHAECLDLLAESVRTEKPSAHLMILLGYALESRSRIGDHRERPPHEWAEFAVRKALLACQGGPFFEAIFAECAEICIRRLKVRRGSLLTYYQAHITELDFLVDPEEGERCEKTGPATPCSGATSP